MLKIECGNVWDYYAQGAIVVVTTNIGWDGKGVNNMGAGVALQAWRRFPELAAWYGRFCTENGAETPVTVHPDRLVLYPVKPLKPEDPAYSWNQRASLELIERSAVQLAELEQRGGFGNRRIVMGFPGCGNGGLEIPSVKPILERHLVAPRFLVVDQAWTRELPKRQVARRVDEL